MPLPSPELVSASPLDITSQPTVEMLPLHLATELETEEAPETTLVVPPEELLADFLAHSSGGNERATRLLPRTDSLQDRPVHRDDAWVGSSLAEESGSRACSRDDSAESGLDGEATYHGTLFPVTSSERPFQEQKRFSVLAGRYELLSLVGVGGMGSVYRARDLALDEQVALKILRADKLNAPGMLERFKQEVRLSRRITHRNVARMFDIGEDGTTRFLTMEFISGVTLAKLMATLKPSPLEPVLEVAIALCEGLQAAHDAGVVHRDLKPENILVEKPSRRVVITDFGIALPVKKASESGSEVISGTPSYMAPEQVEDRPLDGRADLFALGVILFEALTGALPWQSPDLMTLLVQRLKHPAPPLEQQRPELPLELCHLVNSLLSRAPEGRPSSAQEVGQRLRQCQSRPLVVPALEAETVTADMLAQTSMMLPVAILPFQNLGDPNDAYLAEGLMEDIYDGLTSVSGIQLVPRHRARAYAGFSGDISGLKRTLGVDAVLEGTVRRHGPRVRLSARLTCTDDGVQLWSRRFERPFEELLLLGDEAAHELAEALTTHKQEARRAGPTQPEAIELYLRGRREYHKGWINSHIKAVEYLAQAYSLAPDEPLIVASYALALSRRFSITPETAPHATLARTLAEQALSRAPQLGEAHMALAWLALNEGDAPTAAARVRRALKLSPGLVDPYDLAGRLLTETGGIAEGITHIRTALAIDPGLGYLQVGLMRIEGLLGHFDEAERLFNDLPRQPETLNFGLNQWMRVLLWNRHTERLDSVLAILEQHPGLELAPAVRLAIRAVTQPSALVAVVEELHSRSRLIQHNPRLKTFLLQVAAELAGHGGLHDRVAALLQEANDHQLLDLVWLERCPQLAGLRALPLYPKLHAAYQQRASMVLAQLLDAQQSLGHSA